MRSCAWTRPRSAEPTASRASARARRARDLATQLQALTGQHIAIRDGKAVITDIAA